VDGGLTQSLDGSPRSEYLSFALPRGIAKATLPIVLVSAASLWLGGAAWSARQPPVSRGPAEPAGPYFHGVRTVDDDRDSTGFLDLAHAALGRATIHGRTHPGFAVQTFADWKSRDLGHCAQVVFRLHESHRQIRISYNNGLKATLRRKGGTIGDLRAWRPSTRRVAVSVPTRLLGPPGSGQSWRASTVSPGQPGCTPPGPAIAVDFAPDSGLAPGM
jgi:hypothetical protein